MALLPDKTSNAKTSAKLPLAVILGPTATGKSRCAIAVAQKLGGEIISGDSALVYRGLNIGTAKPNTREMAAVPHHLIDILPAIATYNVNDFQKQARQLIGEIIQRGHLPIVVGGTGLYIKALLEGYQFTGAGADSVLRKTLLADAQKLGALALYQRLEKLDAQVAAQIHPHNVRRVVRALEAVLQGSSVSSEREPELVYDACVFGLTMPRELLYRRIDERVDAMLAAGLEAEVRQLLEQGVPPHSQAMQSIGYRQIIAYIKGEMSYTEAVTKLKQATRNFAKRQITWYKKMPYIQWFSLDDPWKEAVYNEVSARISAILAGKFTLM